MKIIFGFIIFYCISLSCTKGENSNSTQQTNRFDIMRDKMVEQQIQSRGVKDKRVLDALRKIPRHKFVPKYLESQAYSDDPLPIGAGQTISQPYIVAYMTEQLELQGNERILEIGTGSGYQAAVLAELCDSVYSVEIIPELSMNAQKVLDEMGYDNVHLKIGDGFRGWAEKAPFDAIIVTAAPTEIPDALVAQLKVGGRMIIPVGDFFQELYLVIKTEKGIEKHRRLPVRFVPMRGESETDE